MANLRIRTNILLVSILLGMFFPLHAQYSIISGLVADEHAQPLPYVTLQLTTPDSVFIQGTTTDEQGNYKLTGVGPGNYLLLLSSIGYEQQGYPFRMENKDLVLPDLRLKSSSVALKEVEVKAQSFVRLEDRVMIIPEKQQVRHAYTGYDLLDNLMIPTLDVDRQNGTVKTFAGEVTLYIDGRKADFREVQSLRPRDVEKVEYFDMPTGKYAMDVASINYITKKYDTGGYVSADAKQTIGYLNGDYNASAKVSHKNTSFTVWGGQRMQNYDGQRMVSDETYTFQEQAPITKHSETTDGRSRTNRQYAQANVENRTDRRTLMAKAGFTRNATPENRQTLQTFYSNHPDEAINTHTAQDQTAIMPNVQLYGNFKIRDNQSLDVNLSGSYSNTLYTRTYEEKDFHSTTQADEDYYHAQAHLNYVLQFKNKHTLAIQAHHFYYNTLTNYTGDYDRLSQVRSNESILFIDYALPLGKKTSLHINPGISSQIYRVDNNKLIHTFFPRLNFIVNCRPTNKQALSFGVNIGNNTPQYNLLNSVEQKIDSFRVVRGNPNLKTAAIYMGGLRYNLQAGVLNFSLGGSYMLLTNCAAPAYYTEQGKIVNTYRSDNTAHFVKGMAGITWKVIPNLQIKANGGYEFTNPKSVIRPFREYLCPLSVLWRRFLLPFLST